jgi:hypothetical protein
MNNDHKKEYDYEPLLDELNNYQLQNLVFNAQIQGKKYNAESNGSDFDYDSWYELKESGINEVFDAEYESLIGNRRYFYGCSFETYKLTYEQRLNSFLSNYIDTSETNFITLELNSEIKYERINHKTKRKINYSLELRNEFLKDKKGQLTTKPQQLETEQTKETINGTELKLPYKIALLHELGFFKLDAIKKLTKENQFKIISSLTGGTHRTVKGNVNVLNPNSDESRIKYTSNNYTDEVKTYLDKLK